MLNVYAAYVTSHIWAGDIEGTRTEIKRTCAKLAIYFFCRFRKKVEASELGTIHNHASATSVALADHLAFFLHHPGTAHRADYGRIIFGRTRGTRRDVWITLTVRRRIRIFQNLREGESKCAHQAKEMKTRLASRRRVA